MRESEEKAFYQHVAQAIRSKREELKIKQEVLAENIGCNRVSISNIETGKQRIPLHTLVEIASYLKTSVMDFLPSTALSNSNIPAVLEKKLSTAEIANSQDAVERARNFVTFTTSNTTDHVSRSSTSTKNRTKGR